MSNGKIIKTGSSDLGQELEKTGYENLKIMEHLFNMNLKNIYLDKKRSFRKKKIFELFLKAGLPNRKDENWKFSDFNFIISKNFKQITNCEDFKFDKKIELINDFDHNHIILVNGIFKSFQILI